jgi:polyisoprenoid-binding protein YceI
MSDFVVFDFLVGQSAVLLETRSNVGPIQFGSLAVEGEAELNISSSDVDAAVALSAVMRIPVTSLASGNSLYDAELQNRLEYRRYPVITVAMTAARPLGAGRFDAEGDVTIHGSTRHLTGTIAVTMPDEHTVVAEGRHVVDIRDFAIRLPSMLMLKIYPDVSVQFRITATRV